MSGVILYFDVEHRGQSAEALCTDAGTVSGVHNFKTQFFNSVLRTTGAQIVDINRCHQGLFGQHHRFFGGAANANAKNAGRAPACPHGRERFSHPVDDAVRGVQHHQLRLVL